MNPVGIREFKAHLGDYVKRARAGEEIIVMFRGEPMFKFTLVDEEEDVLARGIREGWLIPPKRPGGVRPLARHIPDPEQGGESLVEGLIRDRDEEANRIDVALGLEPLGEEHYSTDPED